MSQSKKLAEILPIESADMNYWCGTQIRIGGHRTIDKDLDVPCWSLAALLDVLPRETRLLKSATDDIFYHTDCPKGNVDEWFDNPVDACMAMIEKLHELNLL